MSAFLGDSVVGCAVDCFRLFPIIARGLVLKPGPVPRTAVITDVLDALLLPGGGTQLDSSLMDRIETLKVKMTMLRENTSLSAAGQSFVLPCIFGDLLGMGRLW